MTEPNGLNTKLAVVLTNLGTALTDLASLVSDLNGIRGEDNLGLGDLNSNLAAIRGATEDTRGSLNSLSTGLFDTMGLREGEDGLTLWQLLNGLYNNIGIPTGDATTSVLGRLAAIERLSKCNCAPDAPDLTSEDSPCSSPYTSIAEATRVSSDFPGRIFAGFAAPSPDGIALTNWLAEPIPSCELVRSGSLVGFYAYIQSSAPLASLNPANALQVRTNSWLAIDGYELDMAISVPTGNDLTVYLCIPAGTTWTDCINIDSEFVVYSTDAPFSLNVQAIRFNTIPVLATTDHWSADGSEQTLSTDNTVVTTDMQNTVVNLVSGSNVWVYWIDSSGASHHSSLDAAGASFTVPEPTIALVIGNFGDSSPSTHEFTIQICPPSGD